MEKFETKIPVQYGFVAFVAAMVIGLMMYVFINSLLSSFLMFFAIGILSFALVLFLGIWSGITYRREHGGIISFAHAFLAVYIVFALYSLATPVSMLLINKVIDKDYAVKASGMLKEKMSDYFEQHNVPDDKAKEAMKDMGPEKFDPPFAKLMQNFATWLVGFAIVAALIALFIKRGSADLLAATTPPGM